MKKTASAVLAAALFLLVVNYNERDALPAAHVRGLKQYLQTSGEETISMDDNGMMTSTSTFTITDFSEHIKRVRHHVHNAHKRIKESVKRVVSNLKKHVGIGEDEAGDKEGATRKEITAFVNRPEVMERYHWSKATAALKAKYFYDHHNAFLKFKAGATRKKAPAPVKMAKNGEAKKVEKLAPVQHTPSKKPEVKQSEDPPATAQVAAKPQRKMVAASQKTLTQVVKQYHIQLIAVGVVIMAAGVLAVMRQKRSGQQLEQHYAKVASEIQRYPAGSEGQV